MKQISALIAACSLGLAAQAQIIDPLTGSLSKYTATTVDDYDHLGQGLSFTSSAAGLQANYLGAESNVAEQAMFLAPVSSFSTAFTVGSKLYVNVAVPVSTTQMDLGIVVASTVTPAAASAENNYDSRKTFEWASVSVRPSQTSVRGGTVNSGTLTTTYVASNVAADSVSKLFINWVSANVFTLGYVDANSVSHDLYTATFSGSSTVGTAIGFYGDLRDAGAPTLGNFTDLAIVPAPKPADIVSVPKPASTAPAAKSAGIVIPATGALRNSPVIKVPRGATLDVWTNSLALGESQSLMGSGTIHGSVNAVSGARIYAGTDGTIGTNAITGNLTLEYGVLIGLDLGAKCDGANDLITVGGDILFNNTTFHLKAPDSSADLDTAGDYTLMTVEGNISGSVAAMWDKPPRNAGNYAIVIVGNAIKLCYYPPGFKAK